MGVQEKGFETKWGFEKLVLNFIILHRVLIKISMTVSKVNLVAYCHCIYVQYCVCATGQTTFYY